MSEESEFVQHLIELIETNIVKVDVKIANYFLDTIKTVTPGGSQVVLSSGVSASILNRGKGEEGQPVLVIRVDKQYYVYYPVIGTTAVKKTVLKLLFLEFFGAFKAGDRIPLQIIRFVEKTNSIDVEPTTVTKVAEEMTVYTDPLSAVNITLRGAPFDSDQIVFAVSKPCADAHRDWIEVTQYAINKTGNITAHYADLELALSTHTQQISQILINTNSANSLSCVTLLMRLKGESGGIEEQEIPDYYCPFSKTIVPGSRVQFFASYNDGGNPFLVGDFSVFELLKGGGDTILGLDLLPLPHQNIALTLVCVIPLIAPASPWTGSPVITLYTETPPANIDWISIQWTSYDTVVLDRYTIHPTTIISACLDFGG